MTLSPDDCAERMRRFNRFYTRRIGVLGEGLLDSPFSLTESRVIYELAERDGATASDLCRDLGLDTGYLSRILRRLGKAGLVARRQSKTDGRKSHLSLTAKGRRTFARLDSASHAQSRAMVAALSPEELEKLAAAMDRIERMLDPDVATLPAGRPSYVLRPHRPGDIGWVIHRHAALYAREYGWNDEFEAMVAEIGAAFIRNFDPRRERCWIAERDGEVLGSVFLVRESETVGKLRLLYVEPSARGLGLGRGLVEECVCTARALGYRRLVLWTNDILSAARAIYVRLGFRLVKSEPHRSFGKDLVGEYWELDL